MTEQQIAKQFLSDLFAAVEHGDVEHRTWLKEELMKWEKRLTNDLLSVSRRQGSEPCAS